MKPFFDQIGRLWAQFTIAQRTTLAVAIAGIITAMVLLVTWSRQPDMKLLYGRLGEKDAADVVASLEAQGVKYQIGNGGNSIYVPSDRVYRIRMDLAAKGVPGGEGVGFEIFDRSNFGISDFVQRTNYTRALQGELSRTISQLNGISAARVMVVMPENRLLLKSPDSRPTASVFVEVGGAGLPQDAVNSIRSLVANAVEGLRLDDVAVIDNHGNTLSDQLKSDPLLGNASSQIKYRKQVEDYLGGKVETMLAKVLGPNNAVVRVSADIDVSNATITEEKFDPESQVARSDTSTEDTSITNERTAAAQQAGVGSNVPGGADTANANSPNKSTEDNRKNKTQTYEINKVVTNTAKAPGTIKRLTAAVFISPRPKVGTADAVPRTPAELTGLREMVVNALGVPATTPAELAKLVTIQEVTFEQPATATVSMKDNLISYVDIARPLLTIGLAAGIFLFFLRMLRRTKADEARIELVPTDEQKLLANSGKSSEQKVREIVSPEMLNELIRQKPDNVAAALRGWLSQKEQPGS